MKKLSAMLAALLIGSGLGIPAAHAAPPPKPPKPPGNSVLTMILIGGNDDPTSSDFATRLQNNGWIPKGANVIKINYPADVSQGEYSTQQGSDAIIAAYNTNCQGTTPCELHGASMGTNALIRASKSPTVQAPNDHTRVVLHGSPNAATGTWHSLNNQTFVDYFDRFSATFTVKETPVAGMEHWYHQDDYVANKAPQCFNDAALTYMAAMFNVYHTPQPKNGTNDTWKGPDGLINHEFGASVSPLTVSGNSPNKPTCPPDRWYQ